MGASGTDNFCLRWNDFADNVSGAFKELRAESDFFDVTLACSDSGSRTLQAHKVILSACSNFFKSTFRQQSNANKHPNPYIYLRGVTYTDLTSILDFIYNGEVNVAQEDLNSFLAVAEELQIKGLTNRDNASNNEPSNTSTPSNSTPAGKKSSNSARKTVASSATNSEPAVKKIRRSSPAPTPQIQNIAEPVAEVKEMVNIKDDPEVALASTSAVNPEVEQGQGGEYAGEEYDESYDGYYEDDGTELGDGSQGNDGTKVAGEIKIEPVRLPDGRVLCAYCNTAYSNRTYKIHFETVHLPPEIFKCRLCEATIKHKHYFRKHITTKHFKGGNNLLKNYAIKL